MARLFETTRIKTKKKREEIEKAAATLRTRFTLRERSNFHLGILGARDELGLAT